MKLPLPRVITLIGGGGKTNLMYYLMAAIKSLHISAVATSTTKLANQRPPGVDVVEINSVATACQAVERAGLAQRHLTLVRGQDKSNPEKLAGIPAEWIDQLAAKFPEVAFVVEGDGSAGRSLKGHLAHEPVIPASSNLVIPVIGIDVLEANLDATAVHRPERVRELTGASLGAVIDEELIVKILFHPAGYLRNCLPGQQMIPFINKVETAIEKKQAQILANQILAQKKQRVQSVVIGSIKQNRAQMITRNVSAVILAAGQASRMGQPKQLLTLGGRPMIWHVANQVCQGRFGEVVVVTGAYNEEIRQALTGLPVKFVHNKNWAAGQATSVKKAVQSLNSSAQAVLFALADQPLIDVELLNNLVSAYQDAGASIVIPRCQGRRGNPVLFDLNIWRQQLLNLTGDQGARSIIQANPQAVKHLELTSRHYFIDVDTPDDYQKMKLRWQSGG
ncbi:selenium cofactor biosynthesis protein YqeC [Peptococcaceae bacterium 1198_IL3148]